MPAQPIKLTPKLPAEASDLLNRLKAELASSSENQARLAQSLLPELLPKVDKLELSSPDELAVRAFLLVIQDLLRLRWQFQFEETGLVAYPPDLSSEEALSTDETKERLRASLVAARDEQLVKDRIAQFILEMERPRAWRGRRVSVQDLFLAPQQLARELRDFADLPVPVQLERLPNLIQPYLQQATAEVDEHTGFRLMDIWRYTRYTWSMPFNEVPGRRMYYLIRDAARANHPVIGIGSLGSCVIQLTCRDRLIGWSSEALATDMEVRQIIQEERKPENDKSGQKSILEKRIELFKRDFGEDAIGFARTLVDQLDRALEEIYVEDFVDDRLISTDDLKDPSPGVVDAIQERAGQLKRASINKERTSTKDLHRDAQTELYTRKRATEIKRLLEAKCVLQQAMNNGVADEGKLLAKLLSSSKIRRALKKALRSIKKRHVASSLMDITTCGAVPPYNEILGGKLVGLLMASPQVISEYRARYKDAVSVIASRMKGEEVVRRADLVLLGTTSLYVVGSSQYNRLKAPTANGELRYRHIGQTKGYGSVHLSRRTFQTLENMLGTHPNLELPTNQFGGGVNYKMRVIAAAFSHLGLLELQQHENPRLVYIVPLAKNWQEYLTGQDVEPEYIYDDIAEPETETKALVDYWRIRWLYPRIKREETLQRLEKSKVQVRVSEAIADYLESVATDEFRSDKWPLFEQREIEE